MRHLSSSFMWLDCLPDCQVAFLEGPPLEHLGDVDADDDDDNEPAHEMMEVRRRPRTSNERKTRKVRRWIVRRLQKSSDNEWRWQRFNLVHGSRLVLDEVREAYQRQGR